MISVNCDNSIVIREDRVYRYVGNGSDLQSTALNHDMEQNMSMKVNETHHKEEVRVH